MNKRLKITLAIVAALVIGYAGGMAIKSAFASNGYNYTCPDGGYPIGDGQCHTAITGCPYGDGIPVDSEKCAPPQQPATTTPTPAPAPAASAPVTQPRGCTAK